ncbi:MAG: tetrathionate reductase family octaheme c-type cytochrome [Gammaproteobacteria bacterium]|nr:tetrathionate reductase family octaheme c-type cytochrome [Gammaproteobacteria bacterium]
MRKFQHLHSPPLFALLALIISLGLAGCEGDDGAPGADGAEGPRGPAGEATVINCWDLNENGVGDLDTEDLNDDGDVNVLDCAAPTAGAYRGDALHKGYFTDHPYEGTESCLDCHGKIAEDVMTTAHFTWEGLATNIEGFSDGYHGKNDILNNFCIAVASNEARCTQCHAGYGYADNTFSFDDPTTVDCLVCHDQTGKYAKAKKTAGNPEAEIGDPKVPLDLTLVAQSVAENGGKPTIDNCIDCHAKAGGGDNVKHGDLSMSIANTTAEYDVHMGTLDSGGLDFECVDCHRVKKDGDENVLSHGIGGMPYHSVDEGDMQQCDDCHGGPATAHVLAPAATQALVTDHDRLACQVCHIPTFARKTSTKTEWYWEDAGRDDIEVIRDDDGRPNFDVMKGSFVWSKNVRPVLRWFNGKYRKMLVGANDVYTGDTAVLAEPVGDHTDPEAMIYPFKKMIGNQPADPVNKRILVPHLFGTKGGPNPFWVKYDWDLALQDAAILTGQPYTPGQFGFVPTEMYLSVNHEIAPKEQALGFGEGSDGCIDCHRDNKIDWTGLGWSDDPVLGGTRL